MSSEDSIATLRRDARSLVLFLRRSWLWILLGGVLGGLVGLGMALQIPKTYVAQFSFFINSESTTLPSGFSGILGSVGLDYNKEEQKIEKIQVLAKSDRLHRAILTDSGTVDNQVDLIANHILNLYPITKKWSRHHPELEGVRIVQEGNNLLQAKALNLLMWQIQGDEVNHFSNGFRKNLKSGLMTLHTETTDPGLSYAISVKQYEALCDYYITQTTSAPKQALEVLEHRRDSVSARLAAWEAQLAAFDRRSNAIWSPEDTYKRNQLNRKVQYLSLAFAEIEKNVEEARFVLESMTPYFQLVDRPVLPLRIHSAHKGVHVIAGILLGMAVVILALGIKTLLAP